MKFVWVWGIEIELNFFLISWLGSLVDIGKSSEWKRNNIGADLGRGWIG